MMDFGARRRTPRLKQNRIILHFDYDCFYAQVIENAQPALKSLPLGIKQKSILATCNYVARARGVKKLQLISEARKLCPDLVLADGEDLTAFRDVSKRLYALLKSFSWCNKVERLGLDEIFFDATDMVAYNVPLLNRNALADSWFCLSREDPERGFGFDASALAGCAVGDAHGLGDYDNLLFVKLVLASHLARHIRLKIEEEGYTSACGISTNKLLAKLVGNVNKPRNQTTILSLHEKGVLAFMDSHGLRKVPGIGGKITHTLESFFLGTDMDTDTYTNGSAVLVGQFRAHPNVSSQMLEKLLGSRPGSERGIGEKVWGLLHGCDETEVKAASSVPTQISIEDTYPGAEGGLNTMAEIEREMLKLGASLLRRMHVDLTEDDGVGQHLSSTAAESSDTSKKLSKRRWLAHPKTLRLSTRPKTAYNDGKPYNWGRTSRSQPLPTFVFGNSPEATNEYIVARLVKEALVPMFAATNPGESGWNIGMINICVANMVPTAAAEPGAGGSGRDISQMFRTQQDVLRDFRVHDEDSEQPQQDELVKPYTDKSSTSHDEHVTDDGTDVEPEPEPEPWDDLDGGQECGHCGHHIPPFAMAAHQRFHDLDNA